MGIDTNRSIQQIFDRWQAEDRGIKTCIADIRQWMQEVEMFGIPHFGEAATRLRALQRRMLNHFSSEDEMIAELSQLHPVSGPKLDELCCESSDDHDRLLDQLVVLSERLNQLEPPFVSWQRALEEFEQLVDAIESHEAYEAERIADLMPTETQNQTMLD